MSCGGWDIRREGRGAEGMKGLLCNIGGIYMQSRKDFSKATLKLEPVQTYRYDPVLWLPK